MGRGVVVQSVEGGSVASKTTVTISWSCSPSQLYPFRFGSCGRLRVASESFLYSSGNLSVAGSGLWV